MTEEMEEELSPEELAELMRAYKKSWPISTGPPRRSGRFSARGAERTRKGCSRRAERKCAPTLTR